MTDREFVDWLVASNEIKYNLSAEYYNIVGKKIFLDYDPFIEKWTINCVKTGGYLQTFDKDTLFEEWQFVDFDDLELKAHKYYTQFLNEYGDD